MKKYIAVALLSIAGVSSLNYASLGDALVAPVVNAVDAGAGLAAAGVDAAVDTGVGLAGAGVRVAEGAVVTAGDIATAPFTRQVVYTQDGYPIDYSTGNEIDSDDSFYDTDDATDDVDDSYNDGDFE